jgi:hypothetical protein
MDWRRPNWGGGFTAVTFGDADKLIPGITDIDRQSLHGFTAVTFGDKVK